jgi:hypothetical protein
MHPPATPSELGEHIARAAGAVTGGTVVTLKVAAPLSVALDGDAAILARVTVLKLGPDVSRSDACRWGTWHCHRIWSRRCVSWCRHA